MILNNHDFLGEYGLKFPVIWEEDEEIQRCVCCLILTFLDSITRQYDRR